MVGIPEAPLIRVRGLSTRFGSELIHDNLDLDVMRGEVMGVVGGSRSGKSVLLRAILGLAKPIAGTVEMFGEITIGLDDARCRGLETRFGVLSQEGALFSSLTVAENVEPRSRNTPTFR